MSIVGPTVHVIDDDPAVVKALTRLLRVAGFNVCGYTSAREFLEIVKPTDDGCILSDISMPEIDGLDLQRQLALRKIYLPIIFLTGHGDIAMSVSAMKGGAIDFLTKPAADDDLMRAVRAAFALDAQANQIRSERRAIHERLSMLTPREREVLERVVEGKLNKEVAVELGTVEKTIKVHRARVMQKMRVGSIAELARLAERVGIGRDA